ncbi:MAG: hypothetical protein BAJALOKI2v1_650012 [Promethearchaeota archaeon]|nr:MAG: hypothetical protein BAJALOKI2v1_650012 [Candidatus Lokiarchaeota archaeon]
MKYLINNSYENFLGQKTLLYGDTDTKKTYYTSQFVKYLIEQKKKEPNIISVLDFAPEMQKIHGLKIGGRISDFYEKSVRCNYISISGKIIPPRLEANDKQELIKFARKNYEKTSLALQKYNQKPTRILIMNDISIHLHGGNPKEILNIIKKSQTFFGNSYYGTSISKGFSKEFSVRERKKVETLINSIPNSYHTDKFS